MNCCKYALALVMLGCAGSKPAGSGDSAVSQTSAGESPRSVSGATAATVEAGERRIVFAGTSLTAGLGLEPDSAYPQHVQRLIDEAGLEYEVVNAGVSGETSSALLRRLDWLLRQQFDVFVVETGANDGLRGVPIESMRSNIRQIIERARATRPNARIVLVQMEAPPNLGSSYTSRFRNVFPELARELNVDLIPFLLDGVAGHRELNQADGIHPNEDGSRIVANNVWKALRPLL